MDMIRDRFSGQAETDLLAAAQNAMNMTLDAIRSKGAEAPDPSEKGGNRGAAALEAGTKEAASAILKAQLGSNGSNGPKKLEQLNKQMVDHQKKTNTLLERDGDVAAEEIVLGFGGAD